MATIRQYELKNGAKRWEFQVYRGRNNGNGKQINKHLRGFKTAEDAKRAAKQYELEALENEYDYHETKKYKVGEYLDYWVKNLKKNVKEGTLITLRANINYYLKPYIGQYSLTKYSLKNHQNFINSLFTADGLGRSGKGLSWNTVKSINATLSSAMSKAVKLGYIKTNPTIGVEFPKQFMPSPKDRKLHYWSKDEVNRFLETANKYNGSPFWYLFFLCIFDAGLRVGEVMGLKWSDFDFKKNIITVERERLHRAEKADEIVLDETKTPAGMREIPLTDRLAETALNNRKRFLDSDNEVLSIEERKEKLNDFVFRYTRYRSKGHVVQYAAARFAFRTIAERAQLPMIRVHDGRHTNAVRLRQAGVSLDDIQDLLGHADSKTTKIYAEITPDVKEKAIQKLDEYLSQ